MIQTHNLLNMSLIPLPQDQGFCISYFVVVVVTSLSWIVNQWILPICDCGTIVLWRSQRGEYSSPISASRSPWTKNSSMHRDVHCNGEKDSLCLRLKRTKFSLSTRFFKPHSHPNGFTGVTNAQWPSSQPTAFRSPSCSLITATGSNQALGKVKLLGLRSLGSMGEQSVPN